MAAKKSGGLSAPHVDPSLACAIYTRKSSEEGLEQDFNSLHAQREACEAFAYFGPSWTLVSVRAGHARRLDFDTVLGRSGQLRFGHLDDAGPPSRRDVVKFKACLLVGRPARRGSNLI